MTKLSFYCDDTSPYTASPAAFKTFLDFCSSEGVAGESSAILAFSWPKQGPGRPVTEIENAYIEQLRRAYDCGIDTHFELMTHLGLFDFEKSCVPEGVIHEGVWLYEPSVSVKEYETYFDHIIAEGERIGVRFTGLTHPGCDCAPCTQRYEDLRRAGKTAPNPNVWQALFNLAKRGRFRGRTVPCFFSNVKEARMMAGDGSCGVYDLPPNAADRFMVSQKYGKTVDPDYYITADGESGRIVELVRAGAPYCLFYMHWYGMHPDGSVGWDAFVCMVKRVQKLLRDQVAWVRPSQITDQLFKERVPLRDAQVAAGQA